jgi:bacteriorhodopsin
MIATFATALVNWNALLKIMLAALIGGTGVVIVFGFLLLGISRGKTAKHATQRYALYTLSGVCGVLVVTVAAVGIYAMTQKPSTAKPKPKAAAALAPAATARRLATGPRVE